MLQDNEGERSGDGVPMVLRNTIALIIGSLKQHIGGIGDHSATFPVTFGAFKLTQCPPVRCLSLCGRPIFALISNDMDLVQIHQNFDIAAGRYGQAGIAIADCFAAIACLDHDTAPCAQKLGLANVGRYL